MKNIKFNDISLINAGVTDASHMSLGCQGLILFGDTFAEIHSVCSGFSERTDENSYLAISKSVISTSDRQEAIVIFNRSMEITGSRYASSFVNQSIANWITEFSGAAGGSLDLLSSEEKDRTLVLEDQGASVVFTIVGTRIRVERRAYSAVLLPFEASN